MTPKTKRSQKTKKNIILFVQNAPLEDVQEFRKANKEYRVALMFQSDKKNAEKKKRYAGIVDIFMPVDFSSSRSMIDALKPYQDELVAVTCRGEAHIVKFAKLVPYIPYLRTPTSESLEWSVNKIKMRARFRAYNKSITPKFHIVRDAAKKSLKEIEKKVGFPLVIKPSGLAASLLVTVCYHQEELEKELKKTFRKIKKLHAEYKGKEDVDEPKVLVEELMDGELYSIDGEVGSRGKITMYPAVHVTTGRQIGFDDFFGYKRILPTKLSKTSVADAEAVTEEGVHALGLRSCHFHAELIKTEQGWKVVEIGPRIGGNRQLMYGLSYGISMTENDIFNRIPRQFKTPKKTVKGHTAVLFFYAQKEGVITKLKGTKKAKELRSFHSMTVNKKVGGKAKFAKNGGKAIFIVNLFNKDRSKLLADIRRLEKMVEIKTKRN